MDSLINAGKDFLAKNKNGGGNNQQSNNQGNNQGNNQQSGSGGGDLFSSVLSSLTHKEDEIKNGEVDEKDAAEKHDQVYNKGDNNSSVNAMGTAAAMQALKKFTSGGKEEGNGGKNDFISLAMGEASKLFDSKSADGSTASGADKNSVMQKAAEVAMKLYFKSQMQQSGGGLGGLANMASQFIK